MTQIHPTIAESYEQLTSVRPTPIYVGAFLGLQVGMAAICGSESLSGELLKGVLGPQMRIAMFIWAMAAAIVVVGRNNLLSDYSVPKALLYMAKVPYDLFRLTLGSLAAMFVVFSSHWAIAGKPHGGLVAAIVVASVMSFAACKMLVLGVNLAGCSLRDGIRRLFQDRKFRSQYLLTLFAGGVGLGGERLYELVIRWIS